LGRGIGAKVGADREMIVESTRPRLRFGSAGRNGLTRAKVETLRGHRGLAVEAAELGALAAARGIDVADHALVPGAHGEIRLGERGGGREQRRGEQQRDDRHGFHGSAPSWIHWRITLIVAVVRGARPPAGMRSPSSPSAPWSFWMRKLASGSNGTTRLRFGACPLGPLIRLPAEKPRTSCSPYGAPAPLWQLDTAQVTVKTLS